MELEGQVALITGGTRGIGRGIAEAFVAEGANVVINGRSEEKGLGAVEEMDAGDQVHFIAGDVTKQDVCEGLVEQTVEHFGKIDILVPNAGGGTAEGEEPSPLVDMNDANWQFVIKQCCSSHDWACPRTSPNFINTNYWFIKLKIKIKIHFFNFFLFYRHLSLAALA